MATNPEMLRPEPTPLAEAISQVIGKQGGSISFRDYMQYCLYGISGIAEGFYTSGEAAIGKTEQGEEHTDFYTPPEHTPLFGFKAMATQLLAMKEQAFGGERVQVVIYGDGNGTLASDTIAGVAHYANERLDEMDFLVVDISPDLHTKQKRLLQEKANVTCINESATTFRIPNRNTIAISVEMLDAFPHHVVRHNEVLLEELCIADDNYDSFGPVWKECSAQVREYMDKSAINLELGELRGVCPEYEDFLRAVSSVDRVALLTIDYDRHHALWDGLPVMTFAAESKQIANISTQRALFYKPNVGRMDLTCGADFESLATIGEANGLGVDGHVMLSGWLWGSMFGDAIDKEGLPDTLNGRKRNKVVERLLEVRNHWKVMLQSKGIEKYRYPQFWYPGSFDKFNETHDPSFIPAR